MMGFLAGVIFRGVHRIDKTKTVSYFVGGLSGAVLNTVFFMGLLMVCFWNTDYIQGLNQTMGGLGLWAFLIAFVGINGVVEAIVACAAGGIISQTDMIGHIFHITVRNAEGKRLYLEKRHILC